MKPSATRFCIVFTAIVRDVCKIPYYANVGLSSYFYQRFFLQNMFAPNFMVVQLFGDRLAATNM